MVLAWRITSPTTRVSDTSARRAAIFSSRSRVAASRRTAAPTPPVLCDDCVSGRGRISLPLLTGSTFSSSSSSKQSAHALSDKRKRSLNLATGSSSVEAVRYRLCTSIDKECSCRRFDMFWSRSTTMPPPSTVSIVRASMLGVIASKSCSTSIPKVRPRIFGVSLK